MLLYNYRNGNKIKTKMEGEQRNDEFKRSVRTGLQNGRYEISEMIC